MKKLLCMFICAVFLVTICGCKGTERIRKNLIEAGYKVEDMSENKIHDLNNDVIYQYNGKGTIINGFFATDKYGNNVFVLEFSDREDMSISYMEIKAQLQNGQSIDIKGKTIVYGIEDGVKIALK